MNTLLIVAQCCNTLKTQPSAVVESGANDCNVLIAAIVCLSLVIMAVIAAITISVWHKKELESKEAKVGHKAEPLQEEKDKREYISKLISFREEMAKKDSKIDSDGKACQEYINLLSKLANIETAKQQ